MPDWRLVESMADNAIAIHFDGCHKIYLSMDKDQALEMLGYGYEAIQPNLETLKDWYNGSCDLRFVNAVFTHHDPNRGFVTLVPQFVQEM